MEGNLAEIRMFAGNFAPRVWVSCQGQLMPISSNTALFSLPGTIYGGDGAGTFALPDFRGRVAIGQGAGLLPVSEGETAGSTQVTLQTNQLPSHNHALQVNNSNSAMVATAAGNYLNATAESGESIVSSGPSLVQANPAAVSNTGGNQPVPTMSPYLGIFYIICLQGAYPTRN